MIPPNQENICIRILFLEDRESDMMLAREELSRAELTFDLLWVKDGDSYKKAFDTYKPDIVISDFKLASFDGIKAFNFARSKNPEIPFVMLSGMVGEEMAVQLLKIGVTDFIVKDNLKRLPYAVSRAIKEVSDRLAIMHINGSLKDSEQRLNLALEGARIGLFDWKLGESIYLNKEFADMLGYHVKELQKNIDQWEKFIHPEDLDNMKRVLTSHLKGHFTFYNTEYRMITKSGVPKWIMSHGRVVERDNNYRAVRMIGIHMDIDDRKIYEHSLRNAYNHLEEQILNTTKELKDSIDYPGEQSSDAKGKRD